MSRTIDADLAGDELRAADVPYYLIAFGRALDTAAGGLDWPYFLEKPWKWATEYAAYTNNGFPNEDDGEAWEAFCAAVGAGS